MCLSLSDATTPEPEMFDSDEHANLVHKYLNYYGEKFYSSGPGS